MSRFVFDDFARTTLGGSSNISDQSPLTTAQIERTIAFLKSPASGPDGHIRYAEFLENKIKEYPPTLPENKEYITYSGSDRNKQSNSTNASNYIKDTNDRYGIIGHTPLGSYIESIEQTSGRHPEFVLMTEKLKIFMAGEGITPLRDDYSGALRDIMWNAGSPQFLENAIATGKPLVAFVDGAPANRGFSNFELTTALDHPDVRINGYPVSAFGPEPLEFARKSAAEYQQLERTLAQQATANGSHKVEVADIRQYIKPIDGYDAVNGALFDKPLPAFNSLSLTEMSATRAEWVAARTTLGPGPRLFLDLPEPHTHPATQPGAPRGPPGSAVAEGIPGGMSPAMKAMNIAGVAALAHEFATTGHKWVELRSQGNTAGSDSTAVHFVGRNLGGALGGFAAGAGVGFVTGSWSGPGAILASVAGGVAGAYAGEKWAEQKDFERVYIQTDQAGITWMRNPADPQGRWLCSAHQQQVQSGDLGTGVEVRPVQTALGEDVTFRTDQVASGTQVRYMDWKSASAAYELGLANLPPAKDPWRIDASHLETPPRAAFETKRDFVRDKASGQWELEITVRVDQRPGFTHRLPVEPEQQAALDEQSRTLIAQNAANTKAALAARYMVAHAHGRWSDFADADTPSIPSAIIDAQRSADTLLASDGKTYTRQDAGQWLSDGILFDRQANRNLGDELEITWSSQNAGIQQLDRMAGQIRETVQIRPEGIRGLVESLYAKHGIERSEEQLSATAAAIQHNLPSTGKPTSISLELMPDPRTHRINADSAIATFESAQGNRMVLTATTTMEDVAKLQSQSADAQPLQSPHQSSDSPPLQSRHQPADADAQQLASARQEHAASPVAPVTHDGHPAEAMPEQARDTHEHKPPMHWPPQPGHEDYPLYEQIHQGVWAMDNAHGRSFDAISERMTASLFVLARQNDLSRVDHVVLGNTPGNGQAEPNVFLVQGQLHDPAHLRLSMSSTQAVQTPLEQSMEHYQVASLDAQQRELQRQIEQQSEIQQHDRGRAPVMG